jgi:hypothetical protein
VPSKLQLVKYFYIHQLLGLNQIVHVGNFGSAADGLLLWANKPNWSLTLRHASKPKSELPGLYGAINHGDTQNTLKMRPM